MFFDRYLGSYDFFIFLSIIQVNQQEDKRKHKTVVYREVRLTLAHTKGSVSPIFSATFGDTDATGKRMAYCVKRVGIDKNIKIH